MKLWKLLAIIVISFGSTAHAANPGSALEIDDMPVACLPDRATTDLTSACHCPPVSSCSEMPAFMQTRCGCPSSEITCPAASPGPTTLPACPVVGQKRDINGRCCSDSEKSYVRYKSWHFRWMETAKYDVVRVTLPVRNGITDINWNRWWLPAYSSNYGDMNSTITTNAETGALQNVVCKAVGLYSATGYATGGYASIYAVFCGNFNSGDVTAKVCPLDKFTKPYTVFADADTIQSLDGTPVTSGTQVCSLKNADGTIPTLPPNSNSGFTLSNPQAYKITNCCVYNLPVEASCVAPDTLVLMADGSEKQIQKIVKGDVVKGQTRDNTVLDVVILTLDNRDMYSLNDGMLKLTAEHPILTKDGWKSVNGDLEKAKAKYGLDKVGKLQIGDEIITKDGIIKLASMEKLPLARDTTTFNLKLDGDETFHAAGIIVKDN